MVITRNIPSKDNLICDADGEPLQLFHGTPVLFDGFSATHIHSVGFHFGCRLQAEHRVRGLNPRRIIRCYLGRGRQLLELRKSGDPGWENPAVTVIVLASRGAITIAESHAFGYPTSLYTANQLQYTAEERRAGNALIADALRKKGYDSIAYDNRNEPPDGTPRDAFCVLDTSQIFVLGFEDFSNT